MLDSPPCLVTAEQALTAGERLRALVPSLPADARGVPSKICGLVSLGPIAGGIGYTDLAGRYLIVGVAFDGLTGSALDRAMDGSLNGVARPQNYQEQ